MPRLRADTTWRAGVDVLSFGATKNGALGAEAVVFFDIKRVADFELRRKRSGQLMSKSRDAAAQLLAYIESGLWRRNGRLFGQGCDPTQRTAWCTSWRAAAAG